MYYISEDPNMDGQVFRDSRDLWEARYKEYGAKVDRQTGTISTEHWDYTADVLFSIWNGGYRDGELYAWTPIVHSEDTTYYLEASVHDGYNSALVGVETVNASITEEEFGKYLACAAPSDLMG